VKNRLFVMLLLVFVCVVGLFAQSPFQVPQGSDVWKKEWQLQKLPATAVGVNEVKCGPYFVGMRETTGDTFIVGVVDLKLRPQGNMFIDAQNAWRTIIDEGKKDAPTVEYVPTNIAVVDVFKANSIGIFSIATAVNAKLRISQADYEVATRCLPPPEKK
jgi:hypothetical protein